MQKHTAKLLVSHCIVALLAVLAWVEGTKAMTKWQVPPPPNTSVRVNEREPNIAIERLVETTNDNMESVIDALEHGEVHHAYIVSAVGMETPVRATPKACVRFAENKIEYELTPERSARLASLLHKLKHASTPNGNGADVRVGLILWGGKDAGWRWSAFSDAFGKYGYVGGHSVTTTGDLVTFVNQAFGNLQ
jgi:hypothetical protein